MFSNWSHGDEYLSEYFGRFGYKKSLFTNPIDSNQETLIGTKTKLRFIIMCSDESYVILLVHHSVSVKKADHCAQIVAETELDVK